MSCGTCGQLPDSYVAQTGYGDHLPEAAHRLEKIDIGDNRREIRRCRECLALFDWEDMPQFFGSGNLDEERLDRLNGDQASLVYNLLVLEVGESPADLVGGAAKTLPDGLYHALLHHLQRQAGFEPLVLPLVDLLAKTDDQGLVGVLLDWASRKRERLEIVIGALQAANPLSRFGGVLQSLAEERLAKLRLRS